MSLTYEQLNESLCIVRDKGDVVGTISYYPSKRRWLVDVQGILSASDDIRRASFRTIEDAIARLNETSAMFDEVEAEVEQELRDQIARCKHKWIRARTYEDYAGPPIEICDECGIERP